MADRGGTMLGMADKKKKSGRGRPPKYPGADAAGRSGVPLSIRIDPALRALFPRFQAMFKKQHDVGLDITDVTEMALRRLFREHGLLPPEEPPKRSG